MIDLMSSIVSFVSTLWAASPTFRQAFTFSKNLVNIFIKFRNNVRKDFDSDYEVEIDLEGNKLTQAEKSLNKNPIIDKILGRASWIAKGTLNFVTSPMVSRVIYIAGTAAGIAAASSNPVTLGIAVGGLALVGASIGYGIYKDISRYRKTNKLKHESAMLEEILLLKQQSLTIASRLELSKNKDENAQLIEQLNRIAKLKKTTEAKTDEWKRIHKKSDIAFSYSEQLPESIAPIAINALTVNPVGLGLAIAGHFLEACGKVAKDISYTKQVEGLVNRNNGLAEQLDITISTNGEHNKDLALILANMRARRTALLALSEEARTQTITTRNLENTFIELNATQLADNTFRSNHLKEYKENSFWHDFKEVILKSGFSHARTMRHLNPMINDLRGQYRTDPPPAASAIKPSEEQLEREAVLYAKLKDKKQIKKTEKFLRTLTLDIVGNSVILSPELKNEVRYVNKRYSDNDLKKLKKLIEADASRDEIDEQCEKLVKKLRKKIDKTDDEKHRLALKVVSKVRYVLHPIGEAARSA
jgi:hypothetical protein